jgi:uncharacterized protein (TIGR03790 family)
MAHPLAARVLVIYDSRIAGSQEIARHYQAARGIPGGNLLDVNFRTTQYYIDYPTQWPAVKTAIRARLDALRTILYIVICGNVPYVLSNMPTQTLGGSPFTGICVDSALIDIHDVVATAGAMYQTNPSWLRADSGGNAYPAYRSFAAYRDGGGARIYCVGRLDSHDTAVSKALVDKAVAAENAGGLAGIGYFDARFGDISGVQDSAGLAGEAEWDIYRAKGFWEAAGKRSSYDTKDAVYGHSPAPAAAPNSAFYWGWYQGRYDSPAFGQVFSSIPNGAIGTQIHSSAGMNFRDPNPANRYWQGQAIAAGFTVTHGPVGEPFLAAFAHADTVATFILPPNHAYIGDAILRSSDPLKWQMLTIGDPLYQPFPASGPPQSSPSKIVAALGAMLSPAWWRFRRMKSVEQVQAARSRVRRARTRS